MLRIPPREKVAGTRGRGSLRAGAAGLPQRLRGAAAALELPLVPGRSIGEQRALSGAGSDPAGVPLGPSRRDVSLQGHLYLLNSNYINPMGSGKAQFNISSIVSTGVSV